MAIKESGKVNEYLKPIITLELSNGAKIDCLVDTGFNGTLFILSEHGSALIGAGMMLGAKLEIDYAASTVFIEKF